MKKNFIIAAESPLSSVPFERTAATAIEAEVHLHTLVRICGRNAKIEVWGQDGRPMTVERLGTLALAERSGTTGAAASSLSRQTADADADADDED